MVDDAIVIKDNYFSLPVTKTDTSKARYTFPFLSFDTWLKKSLSSGIFMEEKILELISTLAS